MTKRTIQMKAALTPNRVPEKSPVKTGSGRNAPGRHVVEQHRAAPEEEPAECDDEGRQAEAPVIWPLRERSAGVQNTDRCCDEGAQPRIDERGHQHPAVNV